MIGKKEMDIYEKSLEILKQIIDAQTKYDFQIVLIGGWATWMYNPYMKSRDIDLVVEKEDYWKLKNFLESIGFSETYGEHLGKKGFLTLYQGDKIEIDVYDETVAGFNVKKMIKNSKEKEIENKPVMVASVTDLIIMKFRSVIDRIGSAKGEKDLSDLLAILDKHYKDVIWGTVVEGMGKREIINVMRILLSDIKQAQKIYGMDFQRFQEMKRYFKRKDLI